MRAWGFESPLRHSYRMFGTTHIPVLIQDYNTLHAVAHRLLVRLSFAGNRLRHQPTTNEETLQKSRLYLEPDSLTSLFACSGTR